MKRHLSFLLVLSAAALPLLAEPSKETPAPVPSVPPPAATPAAEVSDDQTIAHKFALNLAGAFGNDGFKLRDGHWAGPVEKGRPVVIEVNVFSGNEYWFSVGATGKARKIRVTVFDEAGRAVEAEQRDAAFDAEGNIAPEGQAAPFVTSAAAFTAAASGRCLVRIEELEGEPAVACLVYSYK